MMDSIGYQFDPSQQKSMADSLNGTTAQFGPLAQRALQILGMRIPSISGGQPLANGEQMMKPPDPQMGNGSGDLQGLIQGVLGGGAQQGGQADQMGHDGGSILFKFPALRRMMAASGMNGGPKSTPGFEGGQQQWSGSAQQGPQQPPGATMGQQQGGSPSWSQRPY